MEDQPPFPGEKPPAPPRLSLLAYIRRGADFVEIGRATLHPDQKGYSLKFDIGPADGDTVELRYVAGERRQDQAAKAPRPRRRKYRPRA